LALLAIGLVAWLWRVSPEIERKTESLPAALDAAPRDAGDRGEVAIQKVNPDSTAPVALPEPADGAIEVQVLAGGTVVPSARVHLYRRGSRDPNTAQLMWSDGGAGLTDGHGLIRIPSRSGRYVVVAERSTGARAVLEVRHAFGEKLTRVRAEIATPVRVAGRTILRGAKTPVPLAQIVGTPTIVTMAGNLNDGDPEVPPQALLHGASDPAGNFQLSIAPGIWQFEASAEGAGHSLAKEVRAPATGPLVLELIGSSYLEGHVLAADGTPAIGAQISARDPRTTAQATSVAGGAFSLEVAPGSWKLSARSGSEAGALPQALALAEGQTRSGLVLQLGPGAVIFGTVVHAGDQQPLDGARISVSPHDENGDSGRTISAADGSYSVDGLAPGLYDVVAERDANIRSETRGVALGAGERLKLGFELAGVGSVTGHVNNKDGRPIEGAVIEARGGNQSEPHLARSGPDGAYRIDGLSGNTRLTATRPNAVLGESAAEVIRENATVQHDFVLPESGRVSGRVTALHGELPEGVKVLAILADGRRDEGGRQIGEAAVIDGRYQLELPASSYRLVAWNQKGTSRSAGASVQLEVDRELTQDLQLGDSGETGLSIQVREPDGSPSIGAEVMLSSERGGRFQRVTTDATGQATVDRPRADLPDAIFLTASNGARAGTATVQAGVTQAAITLSPAASLHGRVTSSSPVDSFSMTVETSAPLSTLTGKLHFSGDTFVLPEVPAGEITLVVTTDDGRTASASSAITAGENSALDVHVVAMSSISGRAVDPSGAPIEGASMHLDGAARAVSDASGVFRFAGIDSGSYTLSGDLDVRLEVTREVEVSEGQQLELGDVMFSKKRLPAGMVGLTLRGDSSGVSVATVIPESPADQAGVRPGDQIVSIDGYVPSGITDATAHIRGTAGAQVVLVIQRGAQTLTLQIARSS
jgi:hypothetical protein